MEIKINIPKNDYVQPTEVREEVVQMICDSLIKHYAMWSHCEGRAVVLPPKNAKISLLVHAYRVPFLAETEGRYEEDIRVRTCEMEAAFEAIQDAGYFIYGTLYMNGEQRYHISIKPYFDGRKATRMHFTSFID